MFSFAFRTGQDRTGEMGGADVKSGKVVKAEKSQKAILRERRKEKEKKLQVRTAKMAKTGLPSKHLTAGIASYHHCCCYYYYCCCCYYYYYFNWNSFIGSGIGIMNLDCSVSCSLSLLCTNQESWRNLERMLPQDLVCSSRG